MRILANSHTRLLAPEAMAPAKSLIVKIILTPVVAIVGLFATRIAIGSLGANGFAIFALVVGLAALLPFADLGIGSAVMDTVARRDSLPPGTVEDVLFRSARLLLIVGAIITSIAFLLSYEGLWGVMLGVQSSPVLDRAGGWALFLFSIGLTLSIGPRILTGLGKNHVVVALQALAGVTTLLLVLFARLVNGELVLYVCAPFLANLVSSIIGLILAFRNLDLPIGSLRARVRQPRGRQMYSLKRVALPMAVITVVLPVAYQSDRLIISHYATLKEVAAYSIAFQLFSTLMGLIASSAMALWPVFVESRQQSSLTRHSFFQLQLAFVGLGLVLAVSLLAGGQFAARIVSGGAVEVPRILLASLSLLLVLQAASYPMAVLLTDRPGLAFQARLHIIMLLVNFPLSLVLVNVLRTSGPVLASVVAISFTLFVPQLIRVRASLPSRNFRI